MFQTITNKFPSVQFDSSSVMETITSLTFSKFVIKGKENGKVLYNSVMLGKLYKGYDLEVNYVFIEDIIGEEVEEMLRQSKFTK